MTEITETRFFLWQKLAPEAGLGYQTIDLFGIFRAPFPMIQHFSGTILPLSGTIPALFLLHTFLHTPIGFIRDGNWHVVDIPMSDFGPEVDLSAVSQFFEILSTTAAISNIE
ncbi:MAG: hypothetical protein ACLQAH_16170, partial [Limisphaerales bacterium]